MWFNAKFSLFNRAARYKFKQYLFPQLIAIYKQINMTIIVSGTNRPNSNSAKISKYYQKILAKKGLKTEIIYLTDLPETMINTERFKQNYEAFKPFQERVSAADKFIFVVPEYNGSFPGILKLFLDCCKFPESFYDKKVALVGHSTGRYGNIRGIDHLTGICNYMHLHVLPMKIHIPSVHQELNESGELFKEDTLKFTHEQMDKFIAF